MFIKLRILPVLYFVIFTTTFSFKIKSAICRVSTKYLRMDDEISRAGIKEELTTRDDYLDSRFVRLSSSGHDLTPMLPNEVEAQLAAAGRSCVMEAIDEHMFLGQGRRGLYVCDIGGLPLFASGSRIDTQCSSSVLVFREPCDDSHVNSSDGQLFCVRSGLLIGEVLCNGTFKLFASRARFLGIEDRWPPESQPENFWGSEGQYRAWNQHEMSDRPLSY